MYIPRGKATGAPYRDITNHEVNLMIKNSDTIRLYDTEHSIIIAIDGSIVEYKIKDQEYKNLEFTRLHIQSKFINGLIIKLKELTLEEFQMDIDRILRLTNLFYKLDLIGSTVYKKIIGYNRIIKKKIKSQKDLEDIESLKRISKRLGLSRSISILSDL